jgi:iron(III) transport system permease protein
VTAVAAMGRHATRRTALWAAFLVVLVALVVTPLVRLQQRALSDGAGSYRTALEDAHLTRVLLTTLALAVGSVAIALPVGTGLAWAAYNLPRRLQPLALIPLVTLMIPPLAQITGWAFLLSPRVGYLNQVLRKLPWWDERTTGPANAYSVPTIIALTGLILVPFVFLFVHTALQGMDVSLAEAARTSGARSGRLFFAVVLPLLRPALIFSAVIVLLLGLGQFTAPLLLGRQTQVNVVTTEMYRRTADPPVDFGVAAAWGTPLLFAGIVLIAVQRLALRDAHRFETMSTRGHRTGGGRSYGAVLALLAYGAVAILLPILSLLGVALAPFWSGKIDVDTWTLGNFRKVYSDPLALRGIRTSLVASVTALAIALPVGYLGAFAVWEKQRVGKRISGVIDFIIGIPLVLPGVLFGAGVLFALSEGPIVLYGTIGAVLVAYVILVLPHVTRVIGSGMAGMGTSMVDAARTSGSRSLRTHFRIVLPGLRRSLGAAAALTLAILMHEFSASLMVRSPSTELMGTILYRYWDFGSLSYVAVMALTMCALTLVAVSLALLVGGRRKER